MQTRLTFIFDAFKSAEILDERSETRYFFGGQK